MASRIAEIITRLTVQDRHTAGMQKAEKAVAAFTATTQKGVDAAAEANKKIATSTAAANQALQGTSNSARLAATALQSATVSSEGLGRSMGGLNTVSLTVATALGNLIGTAIGRMIAVTIDAVTQFGRLHNELARTDAFLRNVGREFEFVRQQATISNQTLEQQANQWISLAQQARSAGLSIEVARYHLIAWNEAQRLTQRPTLLNAMGRAMEAFGNFTTRLDETVGFSAALINLLSGVTNVFNRLASILPTPVSRLDDLNNQLRITNQEIALARAGNFPEVVGWLGRRAMTAAEQTEFLNNALAKQADLEERIALANTENPERLTQRVAMMHQFTQQLEHEIGLGRMRATQQEAANKLFQMEHQLRQQGLILSEQERRAVRSQLEGFVQRAVAASQIEGIRTSLLTAEATEMESFARRMTALQTFYQGRNDLAAEYNALLEQEHFRSSVAMLEIQQRNSQHLIQAQTNAAQALVSVLQQLGTKNKAAAVAAIAVNTGLQVAQAIQNTLAAQTRALAELGPIAGPPVAASIGLWGKAQVGLILAAGTLQAASSFSGGSVPSSRGGSSGGTEFNSLEDNEPRITRSVHISMDKGALWSSEQIQELIEQVNNEVKNGSTLISTSVR